MEETYLDNSGSVSYLISFTDALRCASAIQKNDSSKKRFLVNFVSSKHFKGGVTRPEKIVSLFPNHSLVGQSCSALAATTSKNLATVLCRHSFAESMLLGALALFWLICSEHFGTSLKILRTRWKAGVVRPWISFPPDSILNIGIMYRSSWPKYFLWI